MRDMPDVICTKPKNGMRFFSVHTKLHMIAVLPCGVALYYLAESEPIASKARAVCKLEYDAGADIDRYAFFGAHNDCNAESCPAFKVLRELVEARVLDGRTFDPSHVTIEVDEKAADGKGGVTYICNGDGRCGPISEDATSCLPARFAELEKAAENCCNCRDYRREARDCVELKCVNHGGIIAFFRRLFKKGV